MSAENYIPERKKRRNKNSEILIKEYFSKIL